MIDAMNMLTDHRPFGMKPGMVSAGAAPSAVPRPSAQEPPMPSPALFRRGRGFTLVEVLATLVLLGIVVPVAMRGVSVALAAASTARRTAEAASLAQSKLNELIVDGTWQTSGTTGTFPEHPEYAWSCTNITRDYDMYEVALTVTWLQRGQERSLSVATLVYPDAYAPATSTEAEEDAESDSAATGGGQ